MAQISSHEKVIFNRLFDRNGYVLDFTNNTFAEFFREHGINIESRKYQFNGTSKMKRLRAFWEVESDKVVGKVLEALLMYARESEEVDQNDYVKAVVIVNRLQGKSSSPPQAFASADDFLKREFSRINWQHLNLDTQLNEALEQRVQEIEKTMNAGAALATVFLCGSTLEGLLLDAASKRAEQFNRANSVPNNEDGKPKKFPEWTLSELIEVSHEVGLLSLDVKKHGHSLRDFRNYIHPRQQAVQKFNPDMHTAKISWQVVQAAIADICKKRK